MKEEEASTIAKGIVGKLFIRESTEIDKLRTENEGLQEELKQTHGFMDECDLESFKHRNRLLAERKKLRRENARLRKEAELSDKIIAHLAQHLYDSEGNPIDGWEDWAEAHDQGYLREFAARVFRDPPGEEGR